MNIVRILISCVANFGWPFDQPDVKNAFLHEDLYIEIPPGFSTSVTAEVYVDDIVIAGDDDVEIARFKGCLSKVFEVKDLGRPKYFLVSVVNRYMHEPRSEHLEATNQQDLQGRKMSKSLGNVIDPLDTMNEYGTDALRFTLCMGTAGQDINLSTERLTSNKAFTNKLWNAGKFLLQNLPERSDATAWDLLLANKFDTEAALQQLPLPEGWVVTGLHELIDKVSISYEKFYFGDAAREIYDFFWSHFADWYIESSKTRLYHSGDGSATITAQSVLLYVFENILKLLHPFMPFVTEELWQALPYRKDALIVAPWPSTDLPKNLLSIKRFQNLQSLIRGIRNVRAEYSVEPAKRISASVVATADVLEYISKEKQVLALLSKLDAQNINLTESLPGDANQCVHIVADEGLEAYLPLADMVDVSAEVERLSKRLSKLQTDYDTLLARLSSPSFVEKAPENIVRGVREKASEAEEKISLTKNRLTFLQSTVST
ncbi:Valyl-tRNA synthetase [Triticum urartu]|uniref:valine--tRNA ligase n=1 Tax=Triticum urartu TaxID=4572 RepID=M7ZGM9_TRIUA|nr:Valyl-tRNA synthetase [Triticum urartu]